MPRVLNGELHQHVGHEVVLEGWVHRVRELSQVVFVVVRDRSGLAQVVVRDPELRAEVAGIVEQSVVEIVGTVVSNEKAAQGAEVVARSVEVVSPSAQVPFELFRPTLSEALPIQLDNAAVTLRHPRRITTFAVSAASLAGFRHTLDGLGFTEITTPKIVASATESGANVFALDYFGSKAYLAQSPQFYKQTMVGVFERVYEAGPVFRAEPHDTTRHLASYTSLDVELGYVRDHRDVMEVLRVTLAGMLDAVSKVPGHEAVLPTALPSVPDEIPTIHFADAQALIAAETEDDPRGEPDLAPAHERWLSAWAEREFGSEFLFVDGYPMAKRPFYTHPQPGRPEYSNSFDLLFRGLELVTGGQRLHRYDDYVDALAARGETPDAYAGYLQAFKHGMPRHGGFAIGLERWVARLTGAANIRETTLFPRDLHRLAP